MMPHYCKLCGEYKSNEHFSGRGHAQHICRKCRKLPAAVREERMTLSRIYELPFQLNKVERIWPERLKADSREKIRETAEREWDLRFRAKARRPQVGDDVDEERKPITDIESILNPEYATQIVLHTEDALKCVKRLHYQVVD